MDEEESWTTENFVTKLEDQLDELKGTAEKIDTFYNKETYVLVFICLIYISVQDHTNAGVSVCVLSLHVIIFIKSFRI